MFEVVQRHNITSESAGLRSLNSPRGEVQVLHWQHLASNLVPDVDGQIRLDLLVFYFSSGHAECDIWMSEGC